MINLLKLSLQLMCGAVMFYSEIKVDEVFLIWKSNSGEIAVKVFDWNFRKFRLKWNSTKAQMC